LQSLIATSGRAREERGEPEEEEEVEEEIEEEVEFVSDEEGLV
jgi:hypothetical protein